jgi:hypothetical protein
VDSDLLSQTGPVAAEDIVLINPPPFIKRGARGDFLSL